MTPEKMAQMLRQIADELCDPPSCHVCGCPGSACIEVTYDSGTPPYHDLGTKFPDGRPWIGVARACPKCSKDVIKRLKGNAKSACKTAWKDHAAKKRAAA